MNRPYWKRITAILRESVRYRKGFSRDRFATWTGVARPVTFPDYWKRLLEFLPGPVSVSRAPLWFTDVHETNFLLKRWLERRSAISSYVSLCLAIEIVRKRFLGFPVSRMDFREDRFEYFLGRLVSLLFADIRIWIDGWILVKSNIFIRNKKLLEIKEQSIKEILEQNTIKYSHLLSTIINKREGRIRQSVRILFYFLMKCRPTIFLSTGNLFERVKSMLNSSVQVSLITKVR